VKLAALVLACRFFSVLDLLESVLYMEGLESL
jgi:hypothetical protein